MTTPFPEPFDVQWERTDDATGIHMYVLPGQRTPNNTRDFFRLPAGSYMLTVAVRGRVGGYLEHWDGNTRTRMMPIPLEDHARDRLVGTMYFSSQKSLLLRPWVENPGTVQTTDDMFTLKVIPFPLYEGV